MNLKVISEKSNYKIICQELTKINEELSNSTTAITCEQIISRLLEVSRQDAFKDAQRITPTSSVSMSEEESESTHKRSRSEQEETKKEPEKKKKERDSVSPSSREMSL
ncbi:MAG: hypothetical protein PHY80_01610 [Rickettsiales bacterium]|nr:hypothetical protein [Rickettsiales bacterium]